MHFSWSSLTAPETFGLRAELTRLIHSARVPLLPTEEMEQ